MSKIEANETEKIDEEEVSVVYNLDNSFYDNLQEACQDAKKEMDNGNEPEVQVVLLAEDGWKIRPVSTMEMLRAVQF